jgi:hypothetical protein
MALHLLTSNEVATSCRQRIETCELWLRRIVHDTLSKEFGQNYIEDAKVTGQAVFNTAIRKHVEGRVAKQPDSYARPVDTLQLDHLETVICKNDVYALFFKHFFSYSFPMGCQHVKLTLSRLIPIRNALSHANPITTHEAERVLCASSDIISSIAECYRLTGMNNEFNAPSFIRISDSLGNVHIPQTTNGQWHLTESNKLRPGEIIRIEAEVDTSFEPKDYVVTWRIGVAEDLTTIGSSLHLPLEVKHVSEMLVIELSVLSTKSWHRHNFFDARMLVCYKVLPPI